MKNIIFCLCLVVGGAVLAQPSDSWLRGSIPCPILDVRADPVYTVGVGVVLPASVDGGGDVSLMEWDANAEFLYFHDVFSGDVDLRLHFLATVPLNGAGLDLPGQLLAMAFDGRWTWRYVNETAFQLKLEPGFYSDIKALGLRSLAVPVTLLGIKMIDPTLSAAAGVSVRLGFERVLMPVAGVVWQPTEAFRVEAMLPSSRVIYYINPEWSGHLGWTWESMTYRISDDRQDRGKITLESNRFSAGVTRAVSEEFRVTGEIGVLTGRSLEFERFPRHRTADLEMDNALYLRIGIGGAF